MQGFWKKQLIALATLIAFVTAYATPAWADCSNDAQCKGDRICEKGVCVSPPEKAAPAASSALPPPVAPVASTPPARTAPPPNAPPAAPSKQTAATGAVHVTFAGRSEQVVKMQQRGVTTGECEMPCALDLQPGDYTVKTKGYDEEIEVPAHGVGVTFKKACVVCYVTGGILLGAAIPLFIGGGAILDSAHGDDEKLPGYTAIASGVIFAVTGVAMLIVGIAVGGGGVKVRDRDESPENTARALRDVKSPPKPSFGLTERGLGLTF